MKDGEGPEVDVGSLSRLVEQARAGNASARSEICRQVQDHLQGLAERDLDRRLRGKLNPSDIAQQAMTRMITGFEDFRGSTSREFYAWLNTILRNEINSTRRNWFRERRDVRREHPAEGDGAPPAGESGGREEPADAVVQQREQLARFRRIIERLPADYAEVIRLRGLEERPFNEVAERMSRSVDSVSKLWTRALVKLSEELAKLDESIQ